MIQASQIREDLKTLGMEVAATICKRGAGKCGDVSKFRIPEMSGPAKGIVDSVSDYFVRTGILGELLSTARHQKV